MPTHLFLFSHDEGACWAPKDLFEFSIVLTHWGRMDSEPHSSSRYIPDNWEHVWHLDERAPNGQRWGFHEAGWAGGSRAMIGRHPCYHPDKDLVIPVYAPPSKWDRSPWVLESAADATRAAKGDDDADADALPSHPRLGQQRPGSGGPGRRGRLGLGWRGRRWQQRQQAREAAGEGARRERYLQPRRTLAYFSGNLAYNEPLKYARGVRHKLRQAFLGKPGWRLVGNSGGMYSHELSNAEFCIVPPGGDGWSSRVDDSVRHGCIPVIVMDNVHMPFETILNYSAFSLRVPEADVGNLDAILKSVSQSTRGEMRLAMRRLWMRFIYARSFVDADSYLGVPPPSAAPLEEDHSEGRRRVLPRAFLDQPSLRGVSYAAERGAPDALDTIMLELATRLERSRDRRSGRTA